MTSIATSISLKELRQLINDRRTCFFLGAGASCSSGLPLGDRAAREIVRAIVDTLSMRSTWDRLIRKLDESRNLERYSYVWPRFEVIVGMLARHLPESPRAILSLFCNHGRSACQALLASTVRQPRIWLTTNFDNQIELALRRRPFETLVNRSDFSMASLKEAHLIIKLHGDDTSAILHRDTVATIDQVLRSFPRSARVRLTNVVKGRPLLVIGYAARDPDIAPFLRDIVRNSPMVVWVGRGALSPRITAILQNHPRAIYLSDGFESSIAGRLGAEGIDAAMAISEWHRRLKRWARIGNRKMLLRFLADVAEALNTPESRRIAERLLTEAYTGEPASIERFQLQMEILYRASPRPIRKIKRQLALYGRRFGEVNVDRNTRIIQLTRLATAWQRYGNYSKAEKLLRRALLMSKSAREFSSRYNVQRAFGRFAAFRGGELFSEGLASLRVARSLAARRDAQIEATDAAEDMAICLMRQDRAAEAERILQRCHQVEQEIGNPSRLLNWGINLAESYRIQRKFSLALSELERLRESSGISGDFEQQIKVFGNSALTAICAGKPAMANRWSAIAFRIAGGRPMDEMVANMQYNQGWMRLSLGAWRDAIRFFIDSAATCRRYGGPERTAGALACAGWCCLELGEKRSARARLAEIKDLRIKAMGLHAPEIKVLEVFLESASWDECLDRCRHELAGAHDQLFRGVAYVYERASERMTDQARERCARILVSSALKSKMAFLCARAAAVLSKHGNASRSLARLRKERFRPLRSYLTELNRS